MSAYEYEEATTRVGHRQIAMELLQIADEMVDQAHDIGTAPDWGRVRFFQRDAQVHALLALSAGDDS